jgi:predicted Rossmann-fold nucleotide-binding protein
MSEESFKCIPSADRHHSLTPVLDWLLLVAAGVALGIWSASDAITPVTGQAQRGVAPLGCDILTGGGPGLMQAANEGAHSVDPEGLHRSIGINIELPFEQEVNPFVSQAYGHRTFFSRLHHFMIASDAFVVVPGGIGSLLELSLAWQLLQVRKLYNTPLILVGKMWADLVEWARSAMLIEGSELASDVDFEIPRWVNTRKPSRSSAKIARPGSLRSRRNSRVQPHAWLIYWHSSKSSRCSPFS